MPGAEFLDACRNFREVRPPGPLFAVSTLEVGVAGRELSGVMAGLGSSDWTPPFRSLFGGAEED